MSSQFIPPINPTGNPSDNLKSLEELIYNMGRTIDRPRAVPPNTNTPIDARCDMNCETSCQAACEAGCQTACQLGTTCQNACQTTVCQAACQLACQDSCQTGAVCQAACQLRCQNCQDACQTGATCQSTCQTGCQVGCQVLCQATCQLAPCQTGCQVACQTNCQLGCQAGCEVRSQNCPAEGILVEALGDDVLHIGHSVWDEWLVMENEDFEDDPLIAMPSHWVISAERGRVHMESCHVGELIVTKKGEKAIVSLTRLHKQMGKQDVMMSAGHLYWAAGRLSHNIFKGPL